MKSTKKPALCEFSFQQDRNVFVLNRLYTHAYIQGFFWKTTFGQFQRHGHYISDIFLEFRSSFHIFTMCKSKIIHSHYKAVIMDKPPYEVYAI